MDIHSVRLGFACNSSSTHSVVIVPDPDAHEDIEMPWDYLTSPLWVLQSEQAKGRFLALCLYKSLVRKTGPEIASVVVRDLLAIDIHAETSPDDWQRSVAFGSMEWMPASHTSPVSLEFARDYWEFLRREGVLIVGGDDNENLVSRWREKHGVGTLYVPREDKTLIARKDGNAWTLFSQLTGAKVRFSFEGGVAALPETPELVDMKIADYCDRRCRYCYQDSSPEGGFADTLNIERILDALQRLRVFEVALGGGEPTKHPDFVSILRACRERNIVPNFTTSDLTYYDEEAFGLCGNYAVSVSREYEVDAAWAMAKCASVRDRYLGPARSKLRVQCIADMRHVELEDILRRASYYGLGVTLLGYKAVGRGRKEEGVLRLEDVAPIAELLKRKWGIRISIDTVLAKRLQPYLREMGVPDLLYEIDETYGWYIDAVSGRQGPASYLPATESILPGDCQEVETKIGQSFRETRTR